MYPPMTPGQKTAYDAMVKSGLEKRLAYLIIAEGCESFEEFCSKYSANDMLRIPNFGGGALRKLIGYAQRRGIKVLDDRRTVTPRQAKPKAAAPASEWAGPKWEYQLVARTRFQNMDAGESWLNSQGAQGWELFRVTNSTLFFKRPAP